MKFDIRPENTADITAIHRLTESAFRKAAHTDHTEQFVVQALRNAGALVISLVAESDGQLIGHVAISAVSITDGSCGWYGLGPISVRPDVQGRGVGSALMLRVLAELRTEGAAGCVLLGDPAYYHRFGFAPQPGLLLPEVPVEYFQALSFTDTVVQGEVSYHRAFSATQ